MYCGARSFGLYVQCVDAVGENAGSMATVAPYVLNMCCVDATVVACAPILKFLFIFQYFFYRNLSLQPLAAVIALLIKFVVFRIIYRLTYYTKRR